MTQPTAAKIVAAIPCFNEEQFIGDVVTKTRKYVNKVIVIDDGSTDNTSEVAQASGAEIIKHTTRRGAGAATRSGFEFAKRNQANILVTLDGDGQHNPDEIPQLLTPILDSNADLVIGSRFLKQVDIRKYRKVGIDIITRLYNFGSKVKVADSQCCFRAHSRRMIEAANITEDGFGFSIQILIQARKKGLILKEVPTSCIYHDHGSSLNPVVHGLCVAFTVAKLRIKTLC